VFAGMRGGLPAFPARAQRPQFRLLAVICRRSSRRPGEPAAAAVHAAFARARGYF
jgi:hypothetical protein